MIREHSPNSRAARACEDRWLGDPEFIAIREAIRALPDRADLSAEQRTAEGRRLMDAKWSIIDRISAS